MGIVDTLSAGFERVTRKIWLIAIPVLVDVLVWLGPRISVRRLADQALATLAQVPEAGLQAGLSLEVLREWVNEIASAKHALSMLSTQVLGFTGLASTFETTPGLLFPGWIIEIGSWPGLVAIMLSLVLAGLFAACFAVALLALEAREESRGPVRVGAIAIRTWLRLVALILLVIVIAVGIASGLGMVAIVLSLVNATLATVVVNLVAMLTMWLVVYAGVLGYFAPHAMVLDNVGIVRSLLSSFRVVRRNILAVVGFIILVNLIETGLLLVWRELLSSPTTTLIAIVANAYVSTGLVMATLIFYRDRYAKYQQTQVSTATV